MKIEQILQILKYGLKFTLLILILVAIDFNMALAGQQRQTISSVTGKVDNILDIDFNSAGPIMFPSLSSNKINVPTENDTWYNNARGSIQILPQIEDAIFVNSPTSFIQDSSKFRSSDFLYSTYNFLTDITLYETLNNNTASLGFNSSSIEQIKSFIQDKVNRQYDYDITYTTETKGSSIITNWKYKGKVLYQVIEYKESGIVKAIQILDERNLKDGKEGDRSVVSITKKGDGIDETFGQYYYTQGNQYHFWAYNRFSTINGDYFVMIEIPINSITSINERITEITKDGRLIVSYVDSGVDINSIVYIRPDSEGNWEYSKFTLPDYDIPYFHNKIMVQDDEKKYNKTAEDVITDMLESGAASVWTPAEIYAAIRIEYAKWSKENPNLSAFGRLQYIAWYYHKYGLSVNDHIRGSIFLSGVSREATINKDLIGYYCDVSYDVSGSDLYSIIENKSGVLEKIFDNGYKLKTFGGLWPKQIDYELFLSKLAADSNDTIWDVKDNCTGTIFNYAAKLLKEVIENETLRLQLNCNKEELLTIINFVSQYYTSDPDDTMKLRDRYFRELL